MPKVSVIMPSLNVAPYIRECMESVICQTLKDIEILCVDAGSTDGTWEILCEYAKSDDRIRLFKSQKKSYGYQMNLGLEEAGGDYIGIVETDDYILPEMYEELYRYAVENDADFVKTDFDVFMTLPEGNRLFLRHSLEKENSSARYNRLFTSKDYISSKQTIDVFIWNGIYKREFLKRNQICFQETPGAAFQDYGFRHQVAMSLERGFFLECSFYRYRRDNAGSSTYNSKCMLFNLAECNNLIKIAQERGWLENRVQAQFLAREIAIAAHRPYVELQTWGAPAAGTEEALREFRRIIKGFMEQGVLNQTSAPAEDWLALRMMADNLDFYNYYVRLNADIAAEAVKVFLQRLINQKSVILFGSGKVGSCAYCLIRNSGFQNVSAFCDNDQRRWGSDYMGQPVISPEETVKKYPGSYYVICNQGHRETLREQLLAMGVSEESMTVYTLPAAPMFSTNMSLQTLLYD